MSMLDITNRPALSQHRLGGRLRAGGWPARALAVTTIVAAGCSTHPIPDNVSPYSTEEIVRNVRCEAKEAVRTRIADILKREDLAGIEPERVLEDRKSFERIRRTKPVIAEKFIAYGASTISYKFDFNIVENNDNTGSVTFTLPFTNGEFSLQLSELALKKERSGARTFTTTEAFRDLFYLECDDWQQSERRGAYPLTGSIGIGRIINTFIDVTELGGGKESFTDEISFTTEVRGTIKPTLALSPVMDRFRVTKVEADFTSKRKDIHKLVVSIVFPDLKRVKAVRGLSTSSIFAISQETEADALVNRCIADGEAREDEFRTLRDVSPRMYCRLNRERPAGRN